MNSDPEAQRKRRLWSDLGPRTVSALVLVPVTVVALYFGGVWFALLVAAVFAGAYREWEMMATGQALTFIGWLLIALVAVAALTYVVAGTYSAGEGAFDAGAGAFGTGAVIVAGVVVCLISGQRSRFWRAGGLIYVGLVTIAVLLLRGSGSLGIFAGMFVAITVWMTDSAAFFTGRQVGGIKLSPDISPSKTWSGALGGLAMGALGGTVVWILATPSPWWIGAVLAILVSIAGQIGDLLESALKRRFSIKDSGDMIPGHGGIMDRLDSLSMALLVLVAIGLTRGGLDGVASGIMLW